MLLFARGTLIAGLLVALTGVARADVKVTVSDMHLCCGACLKGVEKAIAPVTGASVTCDKDAASCTITAADDATAGKAVAALAAAGFHGTIDNAKLAMTDDSGAPSGNVKRLQVSGIHNCCGSCTKAIKGAVKDVAGVKEDNCKAKETSFVVEGDFSASALVKALNEAGFHVKVSQ
ncbi:MAG: cation transporter [Planctomycetes bacterium]|nr:cation transporter [Planctomycetota bacterium]